MCDANLDERKGFYISLQGSSDAISIGKGVVKLLGCPKYLALRVNGRWNSIALLPCDYKDVMSFKVPDKFLFDHHCVYRMRSKSFLETLMLLNGLDNEKTYTIMGVMNTEKNIATFDISTAIELTHKIEQETGEDTDEK